MTKTREQRKAEIRLETVRTAFADYKRYEGCGCCANHEEKAKAEAILGGLLGVPMYDDGSGYRFYEFASDEEFVTRMKEATG